MGQYASAAQYYDLLYSAQKDYEAEAELLASVIRASNPGASRLLDVGCGTGAHARSLIDVGFAVDGVDIEPSFVEIAQAKCPEGSFFVGDMTRLDVAGTYDVVVCLFSAIGYVLEVPSLRAAVAGMRGLVPDGGLVIVDPWFEPDQMSDGHVSTLVAEGGGVSICRMSRTVIEGRVSRLEFEYLIGTTSGVERRSETHELGLFSREEMEAAFRDAGLRVERKEKALRTRGLYVGTAG